MLNRIRLKEAYADMAVFNRVTKDADWLDSLFECETRGREFIYDDSTIGHVVFVEDTNGLGRDKVFEVVNKNHKEVYLWHIDGVVYKKTSKCDCAIITSDEMAFIEFKTNASNNTEDTIIDNYHKAREQLQQIVLDVKNRCERVGVNLVSIIPVEAHAVFNPTVPSDNAMEKSIAAKFIMNTGVKLKFDNKMNLM